MTVCRECREELKVLRMGWKELISNSEREYEEGMDLLAEERNEQLIQEVSEYWDISPFFIRTKLGLTFESDDRHGMNESGVVLRQLIRAYNRYRLINNYVPWYIEPKLSRLSEMSSLALEILKKSTLIEGTLLESIEKQIKNNLPGIKFKRVPNIVKTEEVKKREFGVLNIQQLREVLRRYNELSEEDREAKEWNEEFHKELITWIKNRERLLIEPEQKFELNIKSMSIEQIDDLRGRIPGIEIIEELHKRDEKRYSRGDQELLKELQLWNTNVPENITEKKKEAEVEKLINEILYVRPVVLGRTSQSAEMEYPPYDLNLPKIQVSTVQTREYRKESRVIRDRSREEEELNEQRELEQQEKVRKREEREQKRKEREIEVLKKKRMTQKRGKQRSEEKLYKEELLKVSKSNKNRERRATKEVMSKETTLIDEQDKATLKRLQRQEKDRIFVIKEFLKRQGTQNQDEDEKKEDNNTIVTTGANNSIKKAIDNNTTTATAKTPKRHEIRAGRFSKLTSDQLEDHKDPESHKAENKEELLTIQLEEYDYLMRQLYQDEVGYTRQIVSIRYNKELKTYISIARAINDKAEWDKSIGLEQRELEGEGGTIQMVDQQNPSSKTLEEMQLPNNYRQWMQEQHKDPTLKKLLENLNDGKAIDLFKFKENEEEVYRSVNEFQRQVSQDRKNFDIIYRRTIPVSEENLEDSANGPEDLGPLVRRFTRTVEINHNEMKIIRMEEIEQIMVPEHLTQKVIYMGHNKFGHQGNARTATSLKKKFYWATMRKDIQTHVKKCHYCNCRKAENRVAKIPIQRYEPMNRPWDQTHADITGPFNQTRKGNKYLLVIRDRLSKFIILIPLKEKKAEVIRDHLREVFLTFGFPRKLITDRGTEFSLKKLDALLKEKRSDAKVKRISPVAPRANGEVENAMRTIKDILVSYINKFQDNWDENIKEIQSIMNSYSSDSTGGYTPNFVIFSRELPSPEETYLEAKKSAKGKEKEEMMRYIWEEIATKLTTVNVDRFNQIPREPLTFIPYEVEEFAYIKRIPRKYYKTKEETERYVSSRKLQYRYAGPYLIVKKNSDVSYMLDIHGEKRSIHAINMKKA